MRILTAALITAFPPDTIDAQNVGSGAKERNSPQNTDQQKAEQKKKNAADDAYQAALGRIREPRDNYDPWRNAR